MSEESINSEFLVVSIVNSQNQVIKKPLSKLIKKSIKNYLLQLDGRNINNLYELALSELEKPLLDMIMQFTRGNQTKASLMMGINRSTLRKKLKKYGMH
ncbi:DNA-binding transcriptional regulator Fis [Buchnera aphidicola (Muscaphis stroyani)]|uniref:DNA-binding protein Fis n=1 Tax=Buchnera aphidicola (Muscaphis stroyani) TaxID=1241869 RepID=A0A4D6YJ04_9GAMM|nr:DNA-binding transcriptional regulator Fis [Buchnera aphidicola]QCI24455.1 DNA-binding transcriptional regulator Fis [Buchnera aphidicola (Muscaphis stroyani)]